MGLGDCIDCWDNPCTCSDKAGSPVFWINKISAIESVIEDVGFTPEAKLRKIALIAKAKAKTECKRCGSTRRSVGDDKLCDRCKSG